MSDQNEDTGNGPSVSRHLRNVRYCEVIPVTQEGIKQTAWVYNTLGLNHCPAKEWDELTEEEVNEEYGSVSSELNVPRYWVIETLIAAGETTTGETFTFGGIEMALRATIETFVTQKTVGEQYYVPNKVKRDTIFVYKAGELVYELTSPEGDVYMMQSYARIKDKHLTIDDLPSLGERLHLPPGWTYSTRRLHEDFELVAPGVAHVINDDLDNSYQQRLPREAAS